MPIKLLLNMVPKKVWIGLTVIWFAQMLVLGFAGAALYDLAF